jgi:hypothetical protein
LTTPQVTRSSYSSLDGEALLHTIVKLLPWELTHRSLMIPTPLWSEGASPNLRLGLIAANILAD